MSIPSTMWVVLMCFTNFYASIFSIVYLRGHRLKFSLSELVCIFKVGSGDHNTPSMSEDIFLFALSLCVTFELRFTNLGC